MQHIVHHMISWCNLTSTAYMLPWDMHGAEHATTNNTVLVVGAGHRRTKPKTVVAEHLAHSRGCLNYLSAASSSAFCTAVSQQASRTLSI